MHLAGYIRRKEFQKSKYRDWNRYLFGDFGPLWDDDGVVKD
jgi:hypothetical protein